VRSEEVSPSSVTNVRVFIAAFLRVCCHRTGSRVVSSVLVFVYVLAAAQGALAAALDLGQQSIRIAMTQEPPSLNSTKTTDLVSFFVLGHTNEGLLRYDRRGDLVGGVAESWTADETTITFKLKPDARWADGSAVLAEDFVFGWRLVNDPLVASPFAAIMHPIKNAALVQAGELPLSSLGIKAIDSRTLLVELEQPCGYCLSLMPHSVFFPVKAAFYEAAGERYGTEAGTLLSNGPFMLSSWVHDASLEFVKNPEYWGSKNVFLNRIEVAYMSGDNRTRLNLFRDNQIAYVRLGAETVREAVDQRLRVKTFLTGGVAYLWFNMREGQPTANRALRQAIQAAFDPDEYVNQVIAIPGYRATNTLFPSWFKGQQTSFIQEFAPQRVERGVVRARELLAEAQVETGRLPVMTLLTVSSTTGAKAAEYLQGRFKKVLGIDIKVDQQTFKQYLSKARRGEFDLVLSSWYPDYDDIVTYADLMASYNPNNRGRYVNPAYDEQLEILIRQSDKTIRFIAAAELQRMIVSDVPVLPMAETSSAYMQHRQLKGVVRRVFGPDPDFSGARVVP